MTIELFPDQQRSISLLRESMRRYKSVLLQGETGSGKSIMAAYMIAASRAKGLKSAFVVPRKDLLHQMSRTFDSFGITHSFVADKHSFNPYSHTHICTSGTLINRMNKIQPNLIFFDETHYGGAQLAKLIAYYRSTGAWIIGLSASPEKSNGQGLDEYYEDIVIGPTIRELINLKRLSDYRLFAPSKPDLSGVKISNGEYNQGQLASFMEHETVLIGDAVKNYRLNADGKLNITFCTSIKHSEMTAEIFRDAGIPTVHMDGDTPDDQRRQIAKAFAKRELMNICSVDLMCFGYDLAAASGIKTAVIESMTDLAPTQSRPKQRQKNGRVFRYKDYPAIINDHSCNAIYQNGTEHHGYPCKKIEWTLSGRNKAAGTGERAMPIRSCGNCYFVHSPAPSCPSCGHIYPVESRMIEEREGELVELDPAKAVIAKKIEQGRADSLEALIEVGKKRGMLNPEGWAKHVLAGRAKKNGS